MRAAIALILWAPVLGCGGGSGAECTIYADLDGDGYGDPGTEERRAPCTWTEGEVTNGDDCDDEDAARSPEAPEALDGVDNDCDGRLDDGCSLADADATLVAEGRIDAAGTSLVGLGDLDGDGSGDLAVGGPGVETVEGGEGAVWITLGPLSGQRSLATADARLVGASFGLNLGARLAAPGDTDGDGAADLLIASPYASEAGLVWLVEGPFAGEVEVAEGDAILAGASGDLLGFALAGPGDVDGDGFADLLVGGPEVDGGGRNEGVAALLRGPALGPMALADADALLIGLNAGDAAGRAVSGAGDTDGDGLPDLVVGAPGAEWAGLASGVACLALGPHDGARVLDDLDACWTGAEGAYAGWSVAGLEDVNGDGWADIGLGAPGSDAGGSRSGAVAVLHGPMAGAGDLSDASATIAGSASGQELGMTLAGPGDVDGDGQADLLAGAPEASFGAGAAVMIWGGAVGVGSAEDWGVVLAAEGGQDGVGAAVSGAGDLDGDGRMDVLVGAPSRAGEVDGAPLAGAAYALFGATLGG